MHVIRIGKEIAIATNPTEFFADFGLQIKAKSSFRYTKIAELTNGYNGYIPTGKAFEEGGYEIRKPTNKFAKNAGTEIRGIMLELLNKIREKKI